LRAGGWGRNFTAWVKVKLRMKITDNYTAKQRLWAEHLRVAPPPAAPRLPDFKSRRFSSHAEMNQWKQSILRQLAQTAPSDE
jgi:hypothetical protein